MKGFGGLFNGGGPPGMSEDEQAWLKSQQLKAFFGKMAEATAKSTDARHGSLGYALSQGIQGMAGATGPAMNQAMVSDKFKNMREERKRKDMNRAELGAVPRNQMIPAIGPPTPEGISPVAEGNVPRGLGDYLQEYATTAMGQGDMATAAQASGMMPKPTKQPKETWGYESKYNSALKDRFGTLTDDGWVIDPDQMDLFKRAQGYIKDFKKAGIDPIAASVKGEQRARQSLLKEKAGTSAKTGISRGPSTQAPKSTGGGMEVDITGNTVSYQGKDYDLNEDGTVTIDGRKYRVKQ